MELSDAVFGPQSVRLEFADGSATVTETSGESGGVRCDVSVFSQIYCGALSAAHARWYGLLAGDDASISLIDQAFPSGPPFIAPFDWF